jgi:hypothetical protein
MLGPLALLPHMAGEGDFLGSCQIRNEYALSRTGEPVTVQGSSISALDSRSNM